MQFRHVDGQHAGKVARRRQSRSATILRSLAVDHHYEREHALGYFLSFPFDGGPLRDMEAMLQSQTRLHLV